MIICGLLLRGSQKVRKNRLQFVHDGLKLYLKIVQKLQIRKKKKNLKKETPHWWLAVKWKMCSNFTVSYFCFLMFVREWETFWEHCCTLLRKGHWSAFSYSSRVWPRSTRSQFLSCFLISSSGFAKEPHVSPSPYRWKWSKKGWNYLPKSIYRLLTGPGIELRVQESLSKSFFSVTLLLSEA